MYCKSQWCIIRANFVTFTFWKCACKRCHRNLKCSHFILNHFMWWMCLCVAACLDVRYIPKDIAVALDFTLNGKIVFTEEVSGMCAGYTRVVIICGLSSTSLQLLETVTDARIKLILRRLRIGTSEPLCLLCLISCHWKLGGGNIINWQKQLLHCFIFAALTPDIRR